MRISDWSSDVCSSDLSSDKAARARVQQIGERVAAASGAEGIDWEFQLFEEPTPNAFALPGGKIGVNSGMLQVAERDDQLAAVLGHEVGHVVARHPSAQLSQRAALQTALGTIGSASCRERVCQYV